jgi:hypothetical protein
MSTPSTPTSFLVYRWTNPETTSDFPYLAVADDGSALLSIGDYSMTLDFCIPEEAVGWLVRDFMPTGEALECDLSTVRSRLMATFEGIAEFASVHFDADLTPSELNFALGTTCGAGQESEYVIDDLGRYLRLYRDPERLGAVAPAERAMLDVCAATFTEFATKHAAKLTEPPPPRYRGGLPMGGGMLN